MDFENMLAYTKALEENNERAWFHENHARYEQARGEFLTLLDMLKPALAEVSPELGESVLFTDSRLMMYRIPRDMRYSVGAPYYPAFRAYLSPAKKYFLPLSYYLHIDHHECFIESGAYPWQPDDLRRLREYILHNGDEFERIIIDKRLHIAGETSKRVPRGFPADHPMSEWMKYKQYLCAYYFSDEDMSDFDSFVDAAKKAMWRMEPLRAFLSGAFTAGTGYSEKF